MIQRIGKRDHPDRPYDDPRVFVHLNDGRNFLKSGNKQYDLIIYALVDSLVLHSGYSNIRLESYLFTKQAMDDVRKRLRPGGVFVMYNYFRQGWIVSRLQNSVRAAFGDDALVLNLPSRDHARPRRQSRRRFHDADRRRQSRHSRRVRAAARILAAAARSLRRPNAERLRLSAATRTRRLARAAAPTSAPRASGSSSG